MADPAVEAVDYAFRATDVAIVLATFFAPFLALTAQRFIDRMREDKARRLHVFRTLLATRATPLTAEHVQALNLVPLEFYDNDKVLDAWREHLHHLGLDTTQPMWGQRRADLFIALLREMGMSLGYKFTALQLNTEVYMPRGPFTEAADAAELRTRLLEVLRGNATVPMDVRSLPVDEDAAKAQQAVSQQLGDWLAGKQAAKVEVVQPQQPRRALPVEDRPPSGPAGPAAPPR